MNEQYLTSLYNEAIENGLYVESIDTWNQFLIRCVGDGLITISECNELLITE